MISERSHDYTVGLVTVTLPFWATDAVCLGLWLATIGLGCLCRCQIPASQSEQLMFLTMHETCFRLACCTPQWFQASCQASMGDCTRAEHMLKSLHYALLLSAVSVWPCYAEHGFG